MTAIARDLGDGGDRRGAATLGARFRSQLAQLIARLEECGPSSSLPPFSQFLELSSQKNDCSQRTACPGECLPVSLLHSIPSFLLDLFWHKRRLMCFHVTQDGAALCAVH